MRPKSQYALGREFNRRIKMAMDQAGIEIPSPQRSVSFATGPLEVKLARPGEGAQVPAPAPAPVTGQDRTRPPLPPRSSRDPHEDDR